VAGGARSGAEPSPRRARVLGWLFALLCVGLGSALRIHAALTDPNFDTSSSKGLLRSDPGVLYYVADRIVESRGMPPSDFRADPRIEHPAATDVPATLAVGQEFAVAWGYLLLGRGMPLHVFCVWMMGIWASLAVLGVFGLALELSGRPAWAAFAAALWAAMPASYRTVGWILMNEDFSLPWFALHLWLLARAARVRTPASVLLASLPLGIAVATWHATQFFVALEAACVFAWFLRTGRNPMSGRGAWVLPATMLASSAAVPVLRSTLFALSLPMDVVWAMSAAALWRGKGSRAVACLALALALGAAFGISRLWGAGIGEYGHVFALLWEKVLHLGQLPADPRDLSLEARMMWQGPFATLGPWTMIGLLGIAAVAVVPAARLALRAPSNGVDPMCAIAGTLACLSVLVAWLVERTVLLPGLLLPAVLAVAGARLAASRWIPAVAVAALLAQAGYCARRIETTPISWYEPRARETELAELVSRIPSLVPDGEAVAADFMTSTAILAHTRRPILFQPKWESRRSRERVEQLFEAFYHRSPAELRRILLEEYRCRFLVVDRGFFGIQRASWYVAGLPPNRPEPGTCAAVLLATDAAELSAIPGYRLLYRSSEPSDFYRLFELSP
jgi:hypothetical protein